MVRKKYILFRIDKTMYGLKESGKLSNMRVVTLLSSFGFHETSTPCLFRHVSRPILFVLIVDDFGVKYHNRVDFDYLVSCLTTLYHVKAHPTGTKFLGFTVKHDRPSRTLAVSRNHPSHAPQTARCSPCFFPQPLHCSLLLWFPSPPVSYWS
jgi:hypothetical protein